MTDFTDPLVLQQALLGRLYDILTGGSDDVVKTGNYYSWLSPGMPIDAAEWDFMSGIIHPPIVETLVLEDDDSTADESDDDDNEDDEDVDKIVKRELKQLKFTDADATRFAIRSAAIFFRLVDSIPETGGWIKSTGDDSIFAGMDSDNDKTIHARRIGRSITGEYARVLRECEIAEVKQSPANKAKIEALLKILERSVTMKDENGDDIIDPTTNEPIKLVSETDIVKAYNKHKQLSEDAELKVRGARVEAMTSDDAMAVAKANQELPILQARFSQARAMWEGMGFKNQVETWIAEIARLAPQTIASYWQRCTSRLESARVEDPQMGEYYFCSVQSPMILRSGGWTEFSMNQKNLESSFKSYSKHRSGGLNVPIPQTPVTVDLSGSDTNSDRKTSFEMTNLKISFKLASTSILRPHIDWSLIKNKRWRFPKGSEPLSDGGMPPEGSLQAVPTDVVLIKDLVLSFDELKNKSSSFYKATRGSAGFSVLGMNIGGRVRTGKTTRKNSYEIDETNGSITVNGTQIIGFRNQLLGAAPDADPDVANWIAPDISVS